MEHVHSGFWHWLRDTTSAWVVGGTISACTAAGPEKWFEDCVNYLHLPEELGGLWRSTFDLRLIPLIFGMTIAAIGFVSKFRHRRSGAPIPVPPTPPAAPTTAPVTVTVNPQISPQINLQFNGIELNRRVISSSSEVPGLMVKRIRNKKEIEFDQFLELHYKSFPEPETRDLEENLERWLDEAFAISQEALCLCFR